jgi:hypothetical protein
VTHAIKWELLLGSRLPPGQVVQFSQRYDHFQCVEFVVPLMVVIKELLYIPA